MFKLKSEISKYYKELSRIKQIVHFYGNVNLIKNDPLIIKFIQEEKLEIRDGKLWYDIRYNRGHVREMFPIYTFGNNRVQFLREVPVETIIYEDDDGMMKIDPTEQKAYEIHEQAKKIY